MALLLENGAEHGGKQVPSGRPTRKWHLPSELLALVCGSALFGSVFRLGILHGPLKVGNPLTVSSISTDLRLFIKEWRLRGVPLAPTALWLA
jgi:hypothetical protein